MKNKLKTLATKRNIIILAVILVLLGVFLFSRNGSNSANDTHTLKKADFEKRLTLSGKVVATESVDLAFETSGVVAGVYKKVGDKVYKGTTLAALDSGELQASREKARADLLAAEAELNKLKSNTDNTQVLSDKQSVVEAILDAYTNADDAVRSKIDQYFENGATAPEIKYTFEDYFSRKVIINEKRGDVEEALQKWAALVKNLSANNYNSDILSDSRKYLGVVKNLLDTLAPAISSFEISSDLSQSKIDKYISDLSTARTNINNAISTLTSSDDKLRGSLSDVPVFEAKVKAAKANVESFNANKKDSYCCTVYGHCFYSRCKSGSGCFRKYESSRNDK
jgi:multidrug efflux pump subunit AcrA (membrane-fusion protein)